MIKVGNIVTYDAPGYALRSGCEAYADAVVVQENPIVLVSRDADMRWESTVQVDKLKVVGEADEKLLNACLCRLEG